MQRIVHYTPFNAMIYGPFLESCVGPPCTCDNGCSAPLRAFACDCGAAGRPRRPSGVSTRGCPLQHRVCRACPRHFAHPVPPSTLVAPSLPSPHTVPCLARCKLRNRIRCARRVVPQRCASVVLHCAQEGAPCPDWRCESPQALTSESPTPRQSIRSGGVLQQPRSAQAVAALGLERPGGSPPFPTALASPADSVGPTEHDQELVAAADTRIWTGHTPPLPPPAASASQPVGTAPHAIACTGNGQAAETPAPVAVAVARPSALRVEELDPRQGRGKGRHASEISLRELMHERRQCFRHPLLRASCSRSR